MMKFTAHGRVTRDIELKTTPSGAAVVSFSLACDRYAGKEKGSVTEYPNFVAWRANAENLAKFCAKGSELVIEAQYTSRKYQIEGEKNQRLAVEFEVMSFDFCGSKKDGSGNAPAAAPAQSAAPAAQAQSAYAPGSSDDFDELDGDDGDLPF